ncbi:MAG: hypothetical protein ACK42A_08760 [Pyrinomonadaceae bacterium]
MLAQAAWLAILPKIGFNNFNGDIFHHYHPSSSSCASFSPRVMGICFLN